MFPFCDETRCPGVLGRASFHCHCCMEKHPASSVQHFHKNLFIHIIATVPTADLLICVVLLLWIFLQIQFHGNEDAGMTIVPGLDILQWYHSPSPGSHSISSFSLPCSFLAKALWSSTCIYFNAGGSLASRRSDKPAGLNSSSAAVWKFYLHFDLHTRDRQLDLWLANVFWQWITSSHFSHLI